MTREEMEVLMGQLLDESLELDLMELCRMSHASEEFVVALVAEGVIEPEGYQGVAPDDRGHWRFTGRSVRRTQVAVRLHQDLDVNLPGVALALDLLEELRGWGRT